MKYVLVYLVGLAGLVACNSQSEREVNAALPEQSVAYQHIAVNEDSLLKDFQTWYNYHYRNIQLSQPFKALDIDSTLAGKKEFLTKLVTGDFAAFKVATVADTPVYKLSKNSSEDKSLRATLVQLTENELNNYMKEGKPFPAYKFTDIQGNTYNKENTKGKILWVKCWFIKCVACVKEFPELNKLVTDYKTDKNVLFVSLATDDKAALQSFLKQRPFSFAVVASQEKFLNDALKIQAYPTHFLIDKEGIIIKVTNSEREMIPYFKQAVNKT